MKYNPFTWCWHRLKDLCHWYAGLYRGRAWWVKCLAALASAFVALILWMGAVDINFLWLFGRSPGFASGLEPQVSQASELWSADGVMIGKYFNENRTPVEYGEVNPNFWKVLIDTEDERFYKHWGIDPIGLTAAAKDAPAKDVPAKPAVVAKADDAKAAPAPEVKEAAAPTPAAAEAKPAEPVKAVEPAKAEEAAKVEEPAPAQPAEAPAPAPLTHTVKEGEDLVSIAIAYGISPSALMDINDLKPTDEVKPGQVLKLPPNAKVNVQ